MAQGKVPEGRAVTLVKIKKTSAAPYLLGPRKENPKIPPKAIEAKLTHTFHPLIKIELHHKGRRHADPLTQDHPPTDLKPVFPQEQHLLRVLNSKNLQGRQVPGQGTYHTESAYHEDAGK